MTVIAGVIEGRTVYMGADSQVTSNWEMFRTKQPKIISRQVGEDLLLMGLAGSPRVLQLIQFSMVVPERKADITDEHFVFDFASSLRDCVISNGHGKQDDKQDILGSNLLLGYRGCLYVIEDQYQVSQHSGNFYAIGGASEYAMGALATMDKLSLDMRPLEKLDMALHVASEFSIGASGPFFYASTAGYVSNEEV